LRTLVYVPVTLLLLPFAAVSQLFIAIGNACSGQRKSNKNDTGDALEEQILKQFPPSSVPRAHDLVIYGASGFTGRLASLYIARTYGSRKFKWAIAGRRRDALENLRAELAAIDASLSSLPIIIADSTDLSSLCKLVTSTRARVFISLYTVSCTAIS